MCQCAACSRRVDESRKKLKSILDQHRNLYVLQDGNSTAQLQVTSSRELHRMYNGEEVLEMTSNGSLVGVSYDQTGLV